MEFGDTREVPVATNPTFRLDIQGFDIAEHIKMGVNFAKAQEQKRRITQIPEIEPLFEDSPFSKKEFAMELRA